MWRGLSVAALLLAGCASVEDRTEARSGAAFDAVGGGIAGGQPVPAGPTEVRMQAPDPVPSYAVAASPTASGAELADLAAVPGFAGVPAAAGTVLLAQVRTGTRELAVVRPVSGAALAATAGLLTEVAQRTGCLTDGQSWRVDDALVIGLNCR